MMIGFVILHYQNIDVTNECIKYLKRLKDYAKIIIVDNCSPNGTGKILQDAYSNDNDITVILNSSNCGFAAGNNIGFKIARDELGCGVIIVMNSDVFIYDQDFLKKVERECINHSEAAILAVDIVSRYGGHQNPYRYHPVSTKKQKKIILRKRIGQLIYSIPVINEFILSKKPKSSTSKNVKKCVEEKRDILPHGACVIYTKNWTEKEDFCFLGGTFLFCEEEILYDYAMRMGYVIQYVPSIEVYHLEDASQEADNKTLVNKKKMQLSCEIESRKTLLRYRKEWRKHDKN